MPAPLSPLQSLRQTFAPHSESAAPATLVAQYAKKTNSNVSHNTYITPLDCLGRAEQLPQLFPESQPRPSLYGIPISVKDCFDIAGTVTSCGSRFYAQNNPAAEQNSWIAQRLLDSGAILTGKTHLHQLAYGVTGENPDYGNCIQPRDADLLTGGSSSGAAASIQEGSAVVAIATDTGGSIRVPAALSSLAGYRTSHGLSRGEQRWAGGWHLSHSFDTIGLLFADLRDTPDLASAIFEVAPSTAPAAPRIGYLASQFLHDCEPEVLDAFEAWKQHLTLHQAALAPFDPDFWSDSSAIYSPIVASEAAAIHRGHFRHFEPVIAERLAFGASITPTELRHLHSRLLRFRVQMATLFESFDFLIAPSSPVSKLRAGYDHADSRKAILRYTTPASLAGLPAIALPGELLGAAPGTGVQLLAAPMHDAALIAFAATLSPHT